MSTEELDTTAERRVALGCLAVLALVSVSCIASAALDRVTRPSALEQTRACAEACGPGRMRSFNRWNGCECEGD